MTDDAERYVGFHSYADGSPRGDKVESDLRPDIVRSETPAAAKAPPGWRRALLVLTAGAGLTAVAAFGWTLRTAPQADEPPATVNAGGVQVLVRDPPVAPLPESAPLDVMPASPTGDEPEPAQVALRPTLAQAGTPAPSAQTGEAAAASSVLTLPSPQHAEASPPTAEPAYREALRPAPPPRNRFDDCADAPSLAQQMVCDDRRLAAADQRMKAAYAAALDAGVPYRALARDQADWLEVREEAADVGRGAVMDLYRQRTQRLWDLARGRP